MTDAPNSQRLANGMAPAGPERLFHKLDALNVLYRTVQHPPVFTVEEAKALRGEIVGCHTKNLFLRNKKGVMWLVVCLEDRTVDLKDLARRLDAGRLSFGSAERLMKYLGVIPGAVTPFAVINDTTGAVRVALDRAILEREPLNFHPLHNAATTSIAAVDFLRFLEAEHHAPTLIDFGT
jgi:Ala-tRNA(Pro) deacylase